MKRSILQLGWQGILVSALLIIVIGRFTLVWAGNVSTMIEDTGTNIGIGTTNPATKLQVVERITVSSGNMSLPGVDGISLYDYAGNEYIDTHGTKTFFMGGAGAGENAAERYIMVFDNANGNVGIGTGSIGTAKLRIFGGVVRSDSGFQSDGGNRIGLLSVDDWTFTTGGVANRMVITSAGNVGIGTTSPGAKFHVAGDTQIDGNLAAKYQDVAEWVQTSSFLSPGTVVVIDPHGHDQVLAASQSYDTRVAGVVSARPGLLLGEAGEGKVRVAQSGRVKVKVDATYGPISAGDLLVTSPTPGHAMRSSPVKLGEILIHQPGTLLGKALESLEEGQREIFVLLTLQ